MNRKLEWNSGCFEDIGFIYQKAEENKTIAKLVNNLEEKALLESRENCNLLQNSENVNLTKEDYDMLSDIEKERVIEIFGGLGIEKFVPDVGEATIVIEFTQNIENFSACTFFNILNRIASLDGSINLICSEVDVQLRISALYYKKIILWQSLMSLVFPWIRNIIVEKY